MVIYPIFVFLISLSVTSALKQCNDSQKLRVTRDGVEICCSTVKCGQSKTFAYCTNEDGSDRCIDCPPGTYTGDTFDTKQFPAHHPEKWHEVPTICASIPSCELKETIKVGTKCRCNLDKGYFGEDSNNCILDRQKCTNRGVQLTIQGSCVPCPGDTFKQEDDKYRQCINKTVCKSHERESSSGSSTSDRICEKLPTVRPPITTSPPDTGTTNKMEKEDDDSISGGIVAVIVLIIVVVLVIIAVLILYKRNKRFAGCSHRLMENFQSGFQNLRGHRHEAIPLNEPGAVEHSENEPQETRIVIDETCRPSNGINGNCSPAANGAVGSNKTNHNKPRVSKTDRNDTIPKSVSNEDDHLSSLEEETDRKSVINKDERDSNIPTTVEEAESHPPGKTKDSDGFQSLSSSIYDSSSGHEADHSALSSHDRRSESITARQPFLPDNATPMSANDTSTSTGNRPSSSLIENLETMEEPPNENKKKVVFTTPAKKEKVVGLVAPTPRSPENNPANPNFGQGDNRQHQDFPRSNTTEGGIEVETATNDQDYKIATSNSNRAELEPLIVNVPDKQATENQHSVEPAGTNADNGIAENNAQPPYRSSSDNGTQPTHISSSENLTRRLGSSETTESGQPLGTPESDNSQGSSTAQNSMEDDPHENIEVTSRTIANSRTRPVI